MREPTDTSYPEPSHEIDDVVAIIVKDSGGDPRPIAKALLRSEGSLNVLMKAAQEVIDTYDLYPELPIRRIRALLQDALAKIGEEK